MDNLGDINSALAASRAEIERALAPNRTMSDITKLISPTLGMIGFEEIAKSMQSPVYLSSVGQMIAAMQGTIYRSAGIAGPMQHTNDLMAGMREMQAVIESITAPYRAVEEVLSSQSAVLKSMSAHIASPASTDSVIAEFAQTSLAWNVATVGLAYRMNDIGLLSQRELLSARLFEATNAYTSFTQHTMELLAPAPAPGIAARLRGSLNLAECQLLGIADAVSGFIMVPDDEEVPDAPRDLNALYAQQDDLLNSGILEDETDTEAMTLISPTAQSIQRVHRVLTLVVQCNEASKMSSIGEEIFKPTSRLMTVFADLPLISATDRSRFADILDCLYFLFYEGAGRDNLRFINKHGGPLDASECGFIWCIKHLRNKWTRHDADHGKDRDIRRSWEELAETFKRLGLSSYPTNVQHFQHLHERLLILAEDFLTLILGKLTLKK